MNVFLLILCYLISICQPHTKEDSKCDGDGCNHDDEEDVTHNYEKYYKMPESNKDHWNVYLKNIEESVKQSKDCVGVKCYQTQKRNDFRFWIDRGGIKKEDFLHAKNERLGEHYQIINHTLYRQSSCVFPSRCSGNEYFILNVIDKLPDMELVINSHDWPKVNKRDTPSPVLSFSKTPNEIDILYPAWSFWEGGPAVWPIYPTGLGRWDLMMKTMEREVFKWPWEKKLKKGFFRGSRTSKERDPLVYLSWYEPWYADAHYTKNQAYKGKEDTLGFPAAEEIPLESHCNHRYLFNFRGVAASFRFKHLFLCKSLVLHVGQEWIEFFYSAMKPWVHYIPVSVGLTEVKDLLEFARENDEIVHGIASRGHAFITENLKMQDVQDYWYQVLKRYGKLIKWTPVKDPNLVEIRKK